MGVYIKGMEMPSCCMFCPISNYSGCGMINPPVLMTSKEMLADRPDWCPLVPVPEHGRLIDADLLMSTFKDRKGNYYGYDSAVKGEAVDAAPTVIPAEEEMK